MGSSASVSVGDCFRAMGCSLNELRIASNSVLQRAGVGCQLIS
jgi:hypothetical protein